MTVLQSTNYNLRFITHADTRNQRDWIAAVNMFVFNTFRLLTALCWQIQTQNISLLLTRGLIACFFFFFSVNSYHGIATFRCTQGTCKPERTSLFFFFFFFFLWRAAWRYQMPQQDGEWQESRRKHLSESWSRLPTHSQINTSSCFLSLCLSISHALVTAPLRSGIAGRTH